jgi:hypothetical protein
LLNPEIIVEALIGGSGIADGFRLAARVCIISEDAVFDQQDAQISKLLMNPGTNWTRKVFFKCVN